MLFDCYEAMGMKSKSVMSYMIWVSGCGIASLLIHNFFSHLPAWRVDWLAIPGFYYATHISLSQNHHRFINYPGRPTNAISFVLFLFSFSGWFCHYPFEASVFIFFSNSPRLRFCHCVRCFEISTSQPAMSVRWSQCTKSWIGGGDALKNTRIQSGVKGVILRARLSWPRSIPISVSGWFSALWCGVLLHFLVDLQAGWWASFFLSSVASLSSLHSVTLTFGWLFVFPRLLCSTSFLIIFQTCVFDWRFPCYRQEKGGCLVFLRGSLSLRYFLFFSPYLLIFVFLGGCLIKLCLANFRFIISSCSFPSFISHCMFILLALTMIV